MKPEVVAGKAGVLEGAMCQRLTDFVMSFQGRTLSQDQKSSPARVCLLDVGAGARHVQSCSVQVLCYVNLLYNNLFDLFARQMSYQHVLFRPVAGSEPTSPNLSQDECEPWPSAL